MASPLLVLAAGEDAAEPQGIDLFVPAIYDIVWSAVVLAVLLVFFGRFVVPKFRTVLDERAAAIEGGIAKAEVAQAEAASVLEEYTAQLADARVEAASIREQARLDGAKILAELKEQAQAEATRITANARVQIEAERESALASLRAEVGSLAIDLSSVIIGESLRNDATSAAVVDRFLAELSSDQKATT